jgi:hypothetical protein
MKDLVVGLRTVQGVRTAAGSVHKVTFGFPGDEKPFASVPYPLYRRYEDEIHALIEAAMRRGAQDAHKGIFGVSRPKGGEAEGMR